MKKAVKLFTISMLLLGMVVSTSFAFPQVPSEALETMSLSENVEGSQISNPSSFCFWGTYIDDGGTSVGTWDTTLFITNPFDAPMNIDVNIFAPNGTGGTTGTTTDFAIVPNGVLQIRCEDLRGGCDLGGWVSVRSDQTFFGATLLLSLNATGSITAVPPSCGLF